MQPIENPEFPKLRGEKAIKALHDFINELVEQRGKELTDKQTTALIKLANGLISSIKREARSGTSDIDIARAQEMNSIDLSLRRYSSIHPKHFRRTFL